MRILITGSSGQIGTNLALRLQADGHWVFGVDKRPNAWTNAFDTLLQDLSGHYAAYHGGINGVDYPEVDLVVHLAAHAKVHELVRKPHRRPEILMAAAGNCLAVSAALSPVPKKGPSYVCKSNQCARAAGPRAGDSGDRD